MESHSGPRDNRGKKQQPTTLNKQTLVEQRSPQSKTATAREGTKWPACAGRCDVHLSKNAHSNSDSNSHNNSDSTTSSNKY